MDGMSAISGSDVELDFSIEGLFPNTSETGQDPKCKIIAELIQSFVKTADMTGVTQANLQTHAENRYAFLSKEKKLSLAEADQVAFSLYQKGVSAELAQRYASLRLTEQDAKKWTLIVSAS
jgi:hypothetical protein